MTMRLPAAVTVLAALLAASPALGAETPAATASPPSLLEPVLRAPANSGVVDPFEAYRQGYYLTAMDLAVSRAENGDASAMALLGRLFLEGRGIARNVPRAMDWFALAADAGDARAAYEWARLALEDDDPSNDGGVVDRLEMAVASGNTEASTALAFVLLDGRTGSRDMVRAAELMRQGAEAGNAEAQYALALMYRDGAGVVPNDIEATRLMGLAATQGHIEAEVEYAFAIFQGRGVARDEQIGAQWFLRAANGGNAIAQNRVARMRSTGTVLSFDPLEAAIWHLRAKAQGLEDNRLDLFVAALPEELRTEAVRRSAEPLESTQRLAEPATGPAASIPADSASEPANPAPEPAR